jgi:hypothetical protein
MITCIAILLTFGQVQPEAFVEKDGYVEVEAEQFHRQQNVTGRFWEISSATTPRSEGDPDSMEYVNASRGQFVELLPDTRVTHEDELLPGINFSNDPGKSVLEYRIKFQTTGRYYVWVRAFSTGTEDNGIHTGIDGTWPESGRRMQWCDGKNQWTWESKQRTEENHCGEPRKIFLDVHKAGIHTIAFSMREDGFAFDKFVLTTRYEKPGDP